jgi:hypothetical protein
MKKYNMVPQGENKKRALEGNHLNNKNSFAVLNNSYICSLAECMGIEILPDQFDVVDIMKDLEIARHALDRSKKLEHKNPNDFVQEEEFRLVDEIPLLGWKEEGSKTNSFTLVQSKKKKNTHALLENPSKGVCIRSMRSTPSVYRDKGNQGNPGVPKRTQIKKVSL